MDRIIMISQRLLKMAVRYHPS